MWDVHSAIVEGHVMVCRGYQHSPHGHRILFHQAWKVRNPAVFQWPILQLLGMPFGTERVYLGNLALRDADFA